jgi:transcriptional regulator with XRE-family HTH domain
MIKGDILADIKTQIGDRIRELRKERGLSQEELGYKSELHLTHIGAIERGEKNCSIDTLVKVARGLNVNVQTLLDFPKDRADSTSLKKAIIEEIKISSPEIIKILSDILSGLKSLKAVPANRKQAKRNKPSSPSNFQAK